MRTTFFFAGLVGALVGQSEAINLGAESVSDLTTMGDAPVDLDTYLEANTGADNELDAGSESEGGDDKGGNKPKG